MPCESISRKGQTLSQRKGEVLAAIAALDRDLLRRKVRAVVGPNGAITFAGWTENRAGVTDACAFRRIMATGSAIARAEIARAEQMAGVTVKREVLAAGVHSHDGGRSWGKD
jgi:hypothetical protein